MNDAADLASGVGDTLSFGLTGLIRSGFNIGSVNKCSGWYGGGVAAGTALGVAFGAASLGRSALANGVGNIFNEGRTWGTVSRRWHQMWGSAEDLDHMFIPRSMADVNSGWNLVPLSPWVNQQLLNPNSYMWGPLSRAVPYMARALAQAGVAGLYGAVPTAGALAGSSSCGCSN